MKTILLAVSGSIAFYKAYELISLFKKEGFKIKVLLSDGALKFGSRLSFEALSDGVLCSENESWSKKFNHISFSKDCDLVVFAPATINSINKLASGIADNLFMQTLIAASKLPLVIAPAANTNMFLHFSTQRSLELLEKHGASIVYPVHKMLACKDKGVGALANTTQILYECKRQLFKEEFFKDKKVLVTGGGTKEKIDDVRCMSNFSSGKMAKAVADAFHLLGARVTFLSSVEFEVPYEIAHFESVDELENLMNLHKECDFLIMAAAVSDFTCEKIDGKIKKDEHPKGLNLHLKHSKDLLENFKIQGKKIGFKVELDQKNALEHAKKSLDKKGLDMICLNILSHDKDIFGSDFNELDFITKDKVVHSGRKSKKELAFVLAKLCKEL
ncbi:bifunctional phosphopantothenoylcysteine decarboxylase/phosphopantothenate--cysteine ligase CoaBC [Campylobacter sp. MIT 99-7217]|uniref:bifunctional phosphopantothenoylcysteine decarboxylase/phosphopantothenate--cysteine ligase CoaBC n=1 Tax=Campylobacter sp. MIT 99-7217 TaxID=535091 RepID=UPI0011580461|nr:bifunctional phosphopantothenoylcysteine decarboxylase/phosphopantothenate--cysteine ligase CoaBC [Campylobacter sp. MIT 99-7217]TQR34530.1 bifunctional phosphopantothenoylcysteine decarboxylase/phosphopantothenate--cysteine ligase CoaBC [Campylobacter sp. MIT 99-7217]